MWTALTAQASGDTRERNLVQNPSFEEVGDERIPPGCSSWAPWEDIAPEFAADDSVARTGRRSLRIAGAGRTGCYGYWAVHLENMSPGKFYRVCVYARAEGVPHIDRNVGVKLSWLGPGEPRELFHGRRGWQHVGRRGTEGPWHRFERVVWTPDGADTLRIELSLRWAPEGTVWFDDLEVVEVPAPSPRPVRLWVAGFRCPDRTPMGAAKFWAEKIDEAARAGADLIVCPEYAATNYDDPAELLKCSSPVPGPTTDLIAAKARQHRAFVVYNLLENDNNVLYNTSVLIDRDGHIVGKYRKVHLAIYECWAGITPGHELPVFDTELGKIGMLICWDNTFPESVRTLAQQGAEIIALSTAANFYERGIQWRAFDSAVVIAESNTGGTGSCIVNIDGTFLDAVIERGSFASAELDLSAKTRLPDRPQFDDFRSRVSNERRIEAYAPLTDSIPPGDTAPR